VQDLVQLARPLSNGQVAPEAGPLVDTLDRIHDNLRISVTDRCKIRCFYCMPEQGGEFTPVSQILSFGEIMRFLSVGIPLGIRKVRLTGGEPLLRPALPDLITQIAETPGLSDVALTTNAVLLAKMAKPLYDAGLRRLNIHLDTLDRERFRQITRRDELTRVLAGIEAALDAGFRFIKLNAVAIRGVTEADVVPLARFARDRNIEIRYIEFMPLDAQHLWSRERVLLADEMIETLSAEFGPLRAVPDPDPRAPATEYDYADGRGRVGFIASVSRPFCLNCNRLRLTADGKLRYCLFAREETDVRALLASEGSERELERAIRSTVWKKWPGHEINSPLFAAPNRPMYSIGG
jgi:cyclic pyranopterin phosphate synthase